MGCEIDESTYIRDGAGGSPFENLFNVVRVWVAAVLVNDVGQESDLVSKEFAFLRVQDHASAVEGMEDSLDMSFMLFFRSAEDEDIVQVYDTELVDIALQYPIHSPLKSTGCIR